MNYVAIGEATGRRIALWREMRGRAGLCNGSGHVRRPQAIIKPDAAIEHAGIARSVRFMVKHFRRPIRVTDLMVVAGLSRRGFLKSFRKHTGCAPGEVLRLMRIEHAKRLLVERDLTLLELAAAVGFRKTNSFCVAFRSVTGHAPMKYQLLVRADINGQGGRGEADVKRQQCAPARRGSSRLNLNL